MFRKVCILVMVGFFFFSSPLVIGAETDYEKRIKKEQKSLKGLKTNIQKKETAAKKAKKKEENLIVELAQINKKLKHTQQDLNWLKYRLSKTQHKLNKLELDLKTAESEAKQWSQILACRLRRIYKEKQLQTGAIELLSATSSVELAKRYVSLKSITQQTSDLFRKAVEKKQAVEKVKNSVAEQKEEIRKLQEKTTLKEQRLEEQKLTKNKILRKIKRQREKDELQLVRLQESAKNLEKLIANLKEKAARQKLLAAKGKKGEYSWPVAGKVVSSFGKHRHPKLGSYIINQGINIKAPEGQPVVAIERGIVLFAGEFQTYGQMIILNHGNELYTVYAQIKEIMVHLNQEVEKEQVIGTVGSTGLSMVEGPALYFEVRKNGVAEDPLVWLK